MTIQEEMNAMMNGNFTSEVMSEEDREAIESGETDEVVEDENSSPEIGDEIAGTEAEEQSENDETAGETTSEDTKTDEVVDEEVNDVDQDGEADTTEEKEDAQPDEGKEDEVDPKEDEPEVKEEESEYKSKYEELQKQYESAKSFMDKVTGDFKANGKKVKGITDPDKILKNIQKSIGLEEKLNGYGKVKPLMKPLEERGLLQDTAKFDMLMKLADGDREALKYYMKENNIDPVLDLEDMENIKYDASSTLASAEELQFEELQDTAAKYGVEDKFSNTVLRDWDSESAAMLLDGTNGSAIGARLAEQMSNGVYDDVLAIAENMKLTDFGFSKKSSIQQYEEASKVYNAQIANATKAEADSAAKLAEEAKVEAERAAKVEQEKAAIAEARKQKEYEAKLAAKEKEVEAQRDAAVKASAPTKAKTTKVKVDTTKKFDRNAFQQLMRQ